MLFLGLNFFFVSPMLKAEFFLENLAPHWSFVGAHQRMVKSGYINVVQLYG